MESVSVHITAARYLRFINHSHKPRAHITVELSHLHEFIAGVLAYPQLILENSYNYVKCEISNINSNKYTNIEWKDLPRNVTDLIMLCNNDDAVTTTNEYILKGMWQLQTLTHIEDMYVINNKVNST